MRGAGFLFLTQARKLLSKVLEPICHCTLAGASSRDGKLVAKTEHRTTGLAAASSLSDLRPIYFLSVPSGLTGVVPLGPMPLICTITSSSFAPS